MPHLAKVMLFFAVEASFMHPREIEEAGCQVEISGWDFRGNFFVEKAMLHRCDEGGRKALLHAQLHAGARVFVRNELPTERTILVMYQVAAINESPSDDRREVQLMQLRARQMLPRKLAGSELQNVPKNQF